MVWRLIARRGRSEDVRDLPDVWALRAAVMRLRQDPAVTGYRWLRAPDADLRQGCPRCGENYHRPRIRERYCRCGLRHISYDCYDCRLTYVEPPEHGGCGDIPPDQERWSTRGWTMWHWPL